MVVGVRLPGPVPPGLELQRLLGPHWGAWLDRLPGIAAAVAEEWDLTFDGPLWHGFCALVAPVHDGSGGPAVLKIALLEDESEHEHVALQRWRGESAVRLLRADPGRGALLLERLDRADLGELWDEEACQVVGDLYGALHVPPMPQLRQQSTYVERWVAALRRDADGVPVPRRLVDQAVGLAADLVAEPATAMVHGDLHYANVLRGDRDGGPVWLAIDPKPTNGDPHSEIEPMPANRFEEYGEAGSVRDGIRRRFHTLVDSAGFDEHRARDWVVVRAVVKAHWTHATARRGARPMTAAERGLVTRCITVAKAVQD